MASQGLTKPSITFAAGAGFTFAWVLSVFFHNILFTEEANAVICSAFYIAGMAVAMITMGVMGVFPKAVASSLRHRWLIAATAVVMGAGTACSVLSNLETEYGPLILFASMILTGMGWAYFIALWGRFFSREISDPLIAQCSAYGVAVVVFCVTAFLPHGAAIAVSAVMPLVSAACYLVAPTGGTASATEDADTADTGAAPGDAEAADSVFALGATEEGMSKLVLFGRAALASLIFGIVVGLMNFTVQGGSSALLDRHFATLFLMAAGITILVILTYVRFSKRDPLSRDRFVHMYIVAIFVLLAALLVANAIQEHTTLLGVVGLTGYICLRIAFWCLYGMFVKSSEVSPIQVFCLGEGCLLLGLFAGSLLSGFLPVSDGSTLTDSIAIALLLFAYIVVLNDRKVFAFLSENETEGGVDEARLFDERCEELAAAHGLSKRETEVFLLSARGHSAARIAEDLYVSTGTVQTHIKNIYRKFDIHSRQELLDIVAGLE